MFGKLRILSLLLLCSFAVADEDSQATLQRSLDNNSRIVVQLEQIIEQIKIDSVSEERRQYLIATLTEVLDDLQASTIEGASSFEKLRAEMRDANTNDNPAMMVTCEEPVAAKATLTTKATPIPEKTKQAIVTARCKRDTTACGKNYEDL